MSISKSVALAAEVERLRQALRVIRTWAFMDDKPETKGSLVPSHVIELCDKALGREESK